MWIVEMFNKFENFGKISFENKTEAEDFMDFQEQNGTWCSLDYQDVQKMYTKQAECTKNVQ